MTFRGKFIGDVPTATAILDRFLHHPEIMEITGRSYRLKDKARSPIPLARKARTLDVADGHAVQ